MGLFEEFFGRETKRKRRRKSPRAKIKEASRKGLKYEKDAKRLLLKKGYKNISERYRYKGAEVDLIMRKGRKLIAIEAKNLKHPIGPPVVNKLKKKMERSHGIYKGGIIVSRKGATEEAKRLARKSGIQIIKYAGARKKRETYWF